MARQRKVPPKRLSELRVRGQQREPLEADLLAHIVVMLGRQLSDEQRSEASGLTDAVALDISSKAGDAETAS
jgi:hypothetical protein